MLERVTQLVDRVGDFAVGRRIARVPACLRLRRYAERRRQSRREPAAEQITSLHHVVLPTHVTTGGAD